MMEVISSRSLRCGSWSDIFSLVLFCRHFWWGYKACASVGGGEPKTSQPCGNPHGLFMGAGEFANTLQTL